MDRKILVLTTSYPLDGDLMASSFVAQHCENLVKFGYDTSVLCPHMAGQKQKTRINNVDITRFKYFIPSKFQKVAYQAGIPTNLRNSYLAVFQLPLFILSFFFMALKLSKNQRLVYAHWTIPAFIAILIKKISSCKKVIFMNHGVEVFVLNQNYFGRKYIRFILKNSDYVISNSSYTFSKTQEIFEIENHTIISPGFDDMKFFPTLLTFKNKFNIRDDTFVLFSLGNSIERKGYEYLIKSMDILVNQRNETNILSLIGGRGPLLKKYEKMVKECKLEKNVFLVGYISQEDLVTYYNTCDVFVHPAIIDSNNDTEGLGVVLTEANACGKPVIASKVGGIIDVIKHEQNGLLIEEQNSKQLASAILKLKNDPELLKQLGSQARQYALSNFTWKKNVEKTVDLLNKLY